MNVINELLARVEAYRLSNKNPCKNYGSREKAEQATAEMAQRAARYFTQSEDAAPARYVVFYNEAWGRWIGGIDLTELLRRPNSAGYVGFCTGFFTY